MPAQEPNLDLAPVAHIELLAPKPEENLIFFHDVMGMTESGRQGDSGYLRGWDDYERNTLKLSGANTSGLGHAAYRARSPAALERRVAALQAAGCGIGRSDGDMGQGPGFMLRIPDGHQFEIYYETEWYQAPPELRPALKNQAQRVRARGVTARRLDHFNLLAAHGGANRQFLEDLLGRRLTEHIGLDTGKEAGIWLTVISKSYDFAITRDHTGSHGRFHHLTYALDSREEILRAADIFPPVDEQ